MKYCCSQFEDCQFIESNENGTFNIRVFSLTYVLKNLKFCPFCGTELESRFKVEPSGDGYVVFDYGERGAYFHTKDEAEKHASDFNIKADSREPRSYLKANDSEEL